MNKGVEMLNIIALMMKTANLHFLLCARLAGICVCVCVCVCKIKLSF